MLQFLRCKQQESPLAFSELEKSYFEKKDNFFDLKKKAQDFFNQLSGMICQFQIAIYDQKLMLISMKFCKMQLKNIVIKLAGNHLLDQKILDVFEHSHICYNIFKIYEEQKRNLLERFIMNNSFFGVDKCLNLVLMNAIASNNIYFFIKQIKYFMSAKEIDLSLRKILVDCNLNYQQCVRLLEARSKNHSCRLEKLSQNIRKNDFFFCEEKKVQKLQKDEVYKRFLLKIIHFSQSQMEEIQRIVIQKIQSMALDGEDRILQKLLSQINAIYVIEYDILKSSLKCAINSKVIKHVVFQCLEQIRFVFDPNCTSIFISINPISINPNGINVCLYLILINAISQNDYFYIQCIENGYGLNKVYYLLIDILLSLHLYKQSFDLVLERYITRLPSNILYRPFEEHFLKLRRNLPDCKIPRIIFLNGSQLHFESDLIYFNEENVLVLQDNYLELKLPQVTNILTPFLLIKIPSDLIHKLVYNMLVSNSRKEIKKAVLNILSDGLKVCWKNDAIMFNVLIQDDYYIVIPLFLQNCEKLTISSNSDIFQNFTYSHLEIVSVIPEYKYLKLSFDFSWQGEKKYNSIATDIEEELWKNFMVYLFNKTMKKFMKKNL